MPAAHSRGAVQVGEWIVDPALDTLSRAGEIQKLEPRTMRLLMCLVGCAGAVVSQDTLLAEVWSGVVVGPASVYQAISQLRKILGDTDPKPTYIATVPRKGYRLIAVVRPLDANPAVPVALPPPTAPAPAKRRSHVRVAIASIVLLLAAAVAWLPLRRLVLPEASAASIVVLPFIDMSTDKADQQFCDGLTEELSNWLAQIPTLRVVARTSAFAFRGQGQDVRKIGRTLDINHVVEGSLRRSGDHMRITVQLIDASNGYHLWSADYDRPFDDTIKMQEDISRSVAQTLQIRLTDDTNNRFASRGTRSPQVYQQYIIARHYQQLRTRESTDRAIAMYKQILADDPRFALAAVGLSYALLNQGYFARRPIGEVAAEVEPLIATALRVNPQLAEAYAVRGALRSDQSKTREALQDLGVAISENPNDSGAFAEIGRIMLNDGRPREALSNSLKAAALDPLDARPQVQICRALQDMARYDDAAAACQRARNVEPDSGMPLDELAWLAAARGRVDEALRWNAASIKAEPGNFDLYWTRANLFLTIGYAKQAHAAIDEGRAATGENDDADAALATVQYREGGPDAARAHMQTARLDRSAHATTLMEAAYARLLLDEPAAVKPLIERALAAPDKVAGLDDTPWYARFGTSYRLDLATAETQLGNRAAAAHELDVVLPMLNRMIASGVERYAVYELRARVYALQGKPDYAMADLKKAADLGWRRTWWALHEPYLSALRGRNDFQALIAKVSQSNDRLIDRLESPGDGAADVAN